MDLDNKIDELSKKLDDLTALVKMSVKRVSWEEKRTDSGIELVGGPTTVTHVGTVVSTTMLQSQQGMAIAYIILDDNGKFAVLSPEMTKSL
jgi:hypothetical protein